MVTNFYHETPECHFSEFAFQWASRPTQSV